MQSFVVPACLLIVAFLAAPHADSIPRSFEGLWSYGPHLMMAVVAMLGLAWRRGLAFIAAALFLLGVFVIEGTGASLSFATDTFVVAIAAGLVPLNLAIVGWYRERGLVTVHGAIRLALIVVQVAAVSAAFRFWPNDMAEWLAAVPIEASVPGAGTPVSLVLAGFVSVAACVAAALFRPSRFTAALAVGMAGYLFAVAFPGRENFLFASVVAAGVMLVVAMLQDSWSLAYRDDLTGLPSRRALGEMFLSLGNQYTVAMMDVDHFKKFNDTHGHDVGDDVLKMVATHIGRVAGGGKAFRYGGEEFTVVFPSRSRAEAAVALEGVRSAIEAYEMVVRERRSDSDDKSASEQRGRGAHSGQKTVSVTISIGIAERQGGEQPEAVLKRADEALYEAKQAGRNRVVAWQEPKRGKRSRRAA